MSVAGEFFCSGALNKLLASLLNCIAAQFLDLAVLEFRHLDTCGSPCNKQYFPIRSFPPPLAEIGEPLSLVGFPGVLRKTSERSGSFSPVSIAYTISSVSERQIVLADQSGDRKVVGTQFSSTEEVPLGGCRNGSR